MERPCFLCDRHVGVPLCGVCGLVTLAVWLVVIVIHPAFLLLVAWDPWAGGRKT